MNLFCRVQRVPSDYSLKSTPAPIMFLLRAAATSSLSRILSRRGATTAIISMGVVLRLLFLWLIADKPLMSDAVNYNDMSLALLRGVPFVPFFPPGLPLYLA